MAKTKDDISVHARIHNGLVRPKFYLAVELKDQELPGLTLTRFVWGIPALLRIRLWLAERGLKRSAKKLKRFLYS